MKIVDHFKTDWFRYGFETLAVIIGILSAFALESWRDSQKIKEEEHEILINLLHDLQDAEEQSSSLIGIEDESRKSLISALNLHSTNESPPQAFYSDSIFYTVIWSLEMEVPIINSYSDIKNTGNTGLISNEQIRQRFTRLELGINNLRNQYVQTSRMSDVYGIQEKYADDPREPFLVDEERLADDYKLEILVLIRLGHSETEKEIYQQLIDSAGELSASIKQLLSTA